MNLLITGGTGKLGEKLIPVIEEAKNVHLRLLSRNHDSQQSGIETLIGDVTRPETLSVPLEGMDTVLHLAALTHSKRAEDYHKINFEGTKNLLKSCKTAGVRRFIHMSSRAACKDGGAYATSKWDAEEAVRNSHLDWTILKPAEVYGTGTSEGISQVLEWIDRWPILPIIGDGEYSMSPVHIDDIVSATVNTLFEPNLNSQTFVLGGPETMTFNQLVDRLCAIRNKQSFKVHLPRILVQGIVSLFSALELGNMVPDQVPRLICEKESDISRAQEKIGYNPRSIEQGLPGN